MVGLPRWNFLHFYQPTQVATCKISDRKGIVTLSEAKNLTVILIRFFASLRMTRLFTVILIRFFASLRMTRLFLLSMP